MFFSYLKLFNSNNIFLGNNLRAYTSPSFNIRSAFPYPESRLTFGHEGGWLWDGFDQFSKHFLAETNWVDEILLWKPPIYLGWSWMPSLLTLSSFIYCFGSVIGVSSPHYWCLPPLGAIAAVGGCGGGSDDGEWEKLLKSRLMLEQMHLPVLMSMVPWWFISLGIGICASAFQLVPRCLFYMKLLEFE